MDIQAKDKIDSKPKARFLNIIYFIDSNKTRSFQLSLGQFNLIIFASSAILLWSVLTTYLLVQSFHKSDMIKQKQQDLMATIFQYQSQYDDVFMNVYHLKKNTGDKLNSHTKSNYRKQKVMPNERKSNLNGRLKITEKNHKSMGLEQQTARPAEVVPTLTISGASENWSVSVQEPRLNLEGENLKLDVIVKNERSPQKTGGYIWAKIYLTNNEKKRIQIISPKNIANKDGNVDKDKVGIKNYYSIRYYKPKTFAFKIPRGWKGWLDKIEIMMMNEEKKMTKETIYSESGKVRIQNMDRIAIKRNKNKLRNSKGDHVKKQ